MRRDGRLPTGYRDENARLLVDAMGSALCRGACPICGDLALAFAMGGSDDDWLVVGVCRLCAYLAHRPGVKPDLLAELDGGLEGTRFTLPTPVQLLSTNGHQHTALLGALAARGVECDRAARAERRAGGAQ